jgi:WD40 repeat protein
MRALAVLLFCFALCGAVRGEEQTKSWLGATVEDLPADEAAMTHGVKVAGVAPSGPAEKAGIAAGDIILSIDRVEVDNKAGFEAAIASKAPGTKIRVGIRRGASEKRLMAALTAEPMGLAIGTPILQLDTGGHMGAIHSLLFAQGGRLIVSAGDDKVIRVWDRESGQVIRSLRGESGAGENGKIFALALSPDEKHLVAGGEFQHSFIRLYDFDTGAIISLLAGHEGAVQALSFSKDGRFLLSGGGDGTAILWDIQTRQQVVRFQTPAEQRSGIEAVGFTFNQRFALTSGFDQIRGQGAVNIWRISDGQLIATLPGHGDRVRSLAVSVSNGKIASGDARGAIRLWDGENFSYLGELENRSPSEQKAASVRGLAFSPDGRFLLSGNGGRGENYHVHLWDVEALSEKSVYKNHDNGVYAVAISSDGRWAASGGGTNKEIHVWDVLSGQLADRPDHQPLILKAFGKAVWSVAISPEGGKIAWGSLKKFTSSTDRGPLLRELSIPASGQAKLGAPQPLSEALGWDRGTAHHELTDISSRPGSPPFYRVDEILTISQSGRQDIEIAADEKSGSRHTSFTFSKDGKTIVSGGGKGSFAAFAPDGTFLGSFVGHEDIVEALAPSSDGRFLVSGGGDQTVRLWNLRTRELIVTLFDGSGGEWVMWTPQGYYTGSPGADKIVGWQINKGPDQAAEYVTAGQLRKHLNRPDIVAKAIQLASAEEAVRTSHGTGFQLSDLLARPAPRLRIVSPEPDSTVKTPGSVTVRIALDPTPDPVARIRIQVNGRQLDDFLPESGPSFAAGEHTFRVPLAKGRNTIVVTALNEIGWSKVLDGTLPVTNESAGELDKRGTLYILAIGVTKYPGISNLCAPKPDCDLTYTGNDATAFAESLERRLGVLHEKVVRRVLVNEGGGDGAPTAANIVNALGILGRAKPNDTVAVFLAGHGINDGPNYRFVPADAAFSDGMILPASIVPWYAIEEAIDNAKGRRLLFIDTCHSAGAYNERLGNAAYYANILAYSSARWDQEAMESAQFKHGLFTQALVEALNGEADSDHQGRVDTAQLNDYLQRRVPELAKPLKHEQNPQFFKGRDAETYTLAVLH